MLFDVKTTCCVPTKMHSKIKKVPRQKTATDNKRRLSWGEERRVKSIAAVAPVFAPNRYLASSQQAKRLCSASCSISNLILGSILTSKRAGRWRGRFRL